MVSEKKIEYPVEFFIKIVMFKRADENVNMDELVRIFNDNNILNSQWSDRLSSKDKYIRYSVKIVVNSEKQMLALYKDLNESEYVKFAM